MLIDHGWEVTFVTHSHYKGCCIPELGIKVKKIVAHDNLKSESSWIKVASSQLAHYLKGYDKIIVHEALFLSDYLSYNKLLRSFAKEHEKEWFFFGHSAPQLNPKNDSELETPFGHNALYFSLNRTHTKLLAKHYNVPEGYIRVCHNPLDPAKVYGWNDTTTRIVSDLKLFDYDHLIFTASRCSPGKNLEKQIWLAGEMNKMQKTKLLFAFSWADSKESKSYINSLKKIAVEWNADVSFTPDLGYPLGLDKQTVTQLTQYCDINIISSLSEACSLSMLEAGMAGNLTIFNESLNSLEDFTGDYLKEGTVQNGLLIPFGSLNKKVDYFPDEKTFFKEEAERILSALKQNPSLQLKSYVRKYHHPSFIYKAWVEPVLTLKC